MWQGLLGQTGMMNFISGHNSGCWWSLVAIQPYRLGFIHKGISPQICGRSRGFLEIGSLSGESAASEDRITYKVVYLKGVWGLMSPWSQESDLRILHRTDGCFEH